MFILIMQVLHEETLEAVLALLRFHLVNNVLAFHDVYLQRQHRPTLAEGASQYCCSAMHINAACPTATTLGWFAHHLIERR